MTEVTIFGIDLNINPIAFTIGGFKIYWYGIIIGIGFLLALLYALKNASRFELDKDKMTDVVLISTPVAILCARAYFCIFPYADGSRITSFKEFFGIGNGEGFSGLAIYGGVIGAFVTGFIVCKIRKVNILDMFDVASVGFLIGQTLGRWGNFFNQEAYGAVTKSTWYGMKSVYTGNRYVHPCFLYESIWCLIGFFILNHFSKKRKFKGQLFFMYGMWYGFGRFFIEYLRSDSLMIGKIKVSMLVSALLFIICATLLFVFLKKAKIKGGQQEYASQFKEQYENEAEEIAISKEPILEIQDEKSVGDKENV